MMYRRILAIVGDEPQLNPAVASAIALAAESAADLVLLGVCQLPLPLGAPDMVAGSLQALESVLQAQEDRMAYSAAAAQAAGVTVSTMVCWGAFPDLVIHTARERDCDLIVVGSPRCPGWQPRLGGYLAAKVLTHAPCPVLAITKAPPAVYGAPLWSRLLVVHDGTPAADATLAHALTLAQRGESDVCVLTLPAPRPARRFWGHGNPVWPSAALALASTRATLAGLAYSVVPATHDGASAVLQAATEHGCDAILLGTTPRAAWSRLWRRPLHRTLLALTTLPVLCHVPEPAWRETVWPSWHDQVGPHGHDTQRLDRPWT